MKKITVLLLSFVFAANIQTVKAGDGDEKNQSKIGGIRAGWQYSAIHDGGTIPNGYDPLSSFYVGIYKEAKIVPLFRLGGGLEFSQVGNVSNVQNVDNSIKLSYLYIPLYAKLKLGPVFILGGVAPTFKVGEKEVIMGQEIEKTSANKANVFDIPVFLGAGVKIFFLTIEARYSWGMIDVYDGTANSEYDDSKTQYLQVGAAISF
jgi:hypothetical protein